MKLMFPKVIGAALLCFSTHFVSAEVKYWEPDADPFFMSLNQMDPSQAKGIAYMAMYQSKSCGRPLSFKEVQSLPDVYPQILFYLVARNTMDKDSYSSPEVQQQLSSIRCN